jgi:hypothetical protein
MYTIVINKNTGCVRGYHRPIGVIFSMFEIVRIILEYRIRITEFCFKIIIFTLVILEYKTKTDFTAPNQYHLDIPVPNLKTLLSDSIYFDRLCHPQEYIGLMT